jgi:hypothetical protein
MNVERIVVNRAKARELYRTYKKHQHYSAPIDREIQRAYQLIAQGRMVIQAIESVRRAGLNEQHLPKLAICRADAQVCHWRTTHQRGDFGMDSWPRRNEHHSRRVSVPWPLITNNHPGGKAHLPLVPIHLRPKRGLANYHVMWEAEWTRVPPHDPMLLRRIGGDLWLVLATWDLTEVERAALATRMNG